MYIFSPQTCFFSGRPPRVTTTSENGRGVLLITDARPEDEGAYTCEALNNKGSIFAQPDAIVTVRRESFVEFYSYYNLSVSKCFTLT